MTWKDWIIVFLFLLNSILFLLYYLIYRRINIFFKRAKVRNFELLIKELIQNVYQNQQEIVKIDSRLKKIETLSKKNLIKLGLVRFNPFKELGGNQSFSLAILDLEDNGVVISSFYTHQGNRVYAKSVIKGKSEFSLSKEEQEALEKAIKRVRVSEKRKRGRNLNIKTQQDLNKNFNREND
jgi:hypothetical protein